MAEEWQQFLSIRQLSLQQLVPREQDRMCPTDMITQNSQQSYYHALYRTIPIVLADETEMQDRIKC